MNLLSPQIWLRWAAPIFAAMALVAAPVAAGEDGKAAASAIAVPADDWLYAGSDIPRDAGWTFGTLSNGVRYAVRENGVPPGQVAIRVRMDVGSLHEQDNERGFAHLLEHLAFRGSEHIADGEAKRIWQRFGVTFGSDSNAQTTPTHTVFQLDMPSATPTTLDEGVKLLSGMIRAPRIGEASVDAERAVVLAELREADGPQKRIGDRVSAHFFAGQPLAQRSPIGTTETLLAARADRVADFHRRWYRPERALVVIVGDGRPQDFAALVEKHFGGWRGTGAAAVTPSFGDPDPTRPATLVINEPNQARSLTLAMIRPWRHQIDTLAYTRQLYLDFLATALVNRRFERAARRGGSYLVASAQQEVLSRSADTTMVQIVPVGASWQQALTDVRAVIDDALAEPPSQADIDREANEISSFLQKEYDNERNEPGSRLADDMVRAVDIGETVTSPAAQVSMFAAIRASATPEALFETTKKLFSAPVVRAFMVTPGGDPAAEEAELARVLAAPLPPRERRAEVVAVTMADVPPSGPPGRVEEVSVIPGLNARRLSLSNGVTALVVNNDVEPDKVRVNIRFGRGATGIAPDAASLLWSGDYALAASGIGALGQDALEELTNGRQIGFNFAVEDDAFEWSAETRPADLADQLRLFAAKLATPGWDPAPVERLKLGLLTGYEQQESTPSKLIERDLQGWLRAGDRRWRSPTREEIAALTPAAFRAFWEPLLRSGPIEVQVFGDLTSVDIDQLLGETLGSLTPDHRVEPPSDRGIRFPAGSGLPQIAYHRGDAGQAAAMMAWPTGGGHANIRTGRQLDVLAAIFNDRLFDRLRAQDGASYGPIVASEWPTGMDEGGHLLVGSLLAPKDVTRFYTVAEEIARDLAAKPVSADELARNAGPIREQVSRALTGNLFWMYLLEGATRDPRVVRSALTIERDTAEVTAADIQQLAQRYLVDTPRWSLAILPQGQSLDGAGSKSR
jgi:zinc protease